ncbi:hypothetical protein SAMN05660420_01664 [Desulfuromusa kysingii]|uniref:Uncharacterized protein n=1 Tax=Desulfuromusa kysingii TaxID=37625 RepID=A0A1H3ZT46_9BACT|nr:hypothetical protein [Desulfuromusa kysingii]SEA26887.1 hypothetical protein SAMN05660420_01664 [Desulfuromusa kysingii]
MDKITTKLLQLANDAEQAFSRSAQNQSVCQLHKQGQVTNRLKYCEARDSVVRQILRTTRGDKPTVEKIIQNLEQIETKHLALKNSLVLTSPDWQSYVAGALSMVNDIKAILKEE